MAYPTIDTFSSLIDEVITSLQGYGTANDQVATLTSNIDIGELTFTVDDTDNTSRGLIEIDDEIMYVDSVDNGTVTIPAWGRGYKGTTPSAHTAGSPMWIAPTWPRATVAREVNNTIRAVYPNLFAVGTVDLPSTSTSYQYGLPADVERVLSVQWRWSIPNGWEPVRSWEMVHSAMASDFPTGKALLIGDAVPAGATLHVTYAKLPVPLSSSSSLFTDSGLSASSRDVIVLGTAARLVPWQDTARLPVETVPSDAIDLGKPVGMATQVASALRTNYTARLQEERRALLERYPLRAHKVR